MPTLLRVLIAVGLPMAGAATVAGTYLGKEIILCAGWIAIFVTTFLFAQPVIGIALMTGAFLMAAYPTTLLQSLGVLTVNNLLGICLLGLMALRIVETRDFSFLRNRQVRILVVIGLLLFIGTVHSDWIFPTLQQTVGKMKVLDKSATMGHDFVARLVYLVFFIVFVRDRRDIRTLFIVFMLALFIAVPSALYNMATGELNRGFRLQASVTSGANPNRLAMICLMEIACWWFWARSRPGMLRQVVALGVMAASTMVIFGTGSRSGLLGVGVLGVLLQTSQRRFRVPSGQIALLGAAAVFAVATMVPAEAWERMITFNPQKGEIGATSNQMPRRRSGARSRSRRTIRRSASASATSESASGLSGRVLAAAEPYLWAAAERSSSRRLPLALLDAWGDTSTCSLGSRIATTRSAPPRAPSASSFSSTASSRSSPTCG
jgi:hypothetical protein